MKCIWYLCFLILCQSFALGSNYQVGHRQITFIDTTRANRQIQCEIYYPATIAGDNVAIASGKFPVLIYGHGFVMPVSVYDVYWNALVPKGYIIVLPTTESSFSPSHTNFGKDLAYAAKSMRLQGSLPNSPFFNAVDSTSAVMGHSMGGGCAFLAMQYDPQITALVSFAGAITNPSSVTAAMSIIKPSLVIAGANDCVAPPRNHQIPMYDSLAAQCKSYVSIIGANHCQFAS
ncbi:MAG: alpha/beta hydrolase family protein, partial [Ignavibacteria bacterium]